MTRCENCNKHLDTKRDIVAHLEKVHGIHVKMGDDSHLAYCNDCHKVRQETSIVYYNL